MVYLLSQETVFSTMDKDPVTKTKKVVSAVKKIVDSDNDNIPDDEDECPNIPGLAITKGCPDSDGDKIPDHKDECPTIFGLAQHNGCPDTDLDGIPDHKDVCPYEAGPASNNGCPLLEEKEIKYVAKESKVIDTINLDEERNLQIMRYERYVAELELRRQEYMAQLVNDNADTNPAIFDDALDLQIMRNERYASEMELELDEKAAKSVNNDSAKKGSTSTTANETKRVVVTNPDKSSEKTNNIKTGTKEKEKAKPLIIDKKPMQLADLVPEEVPATSPATSPSTSPSTSTVKINDEKYMNYKSRLEAIVKNMKFQDGRVSFADENNFFRALSLLASYCKTYPEWRLLFYCYSTETDNAFRNKQLFSNRVYAIKQILVGDLHVSSDRINFVNSISHIPNVSNYISLEIIVKK
jgi:hypothetical protein